MNGNIVANNNTTPPTVTTPTINAQGMANFENVAFPEMLSTESNSDLEMTVMVQETLLLIIVLRLKT